MRKKGWFCCYSLQNIWTIYTFFKKKKKKRVQASKSQSYKPLDFVFQRAAKKNTSQANEALQQDTTHPIQRPRYQRGRQCQDPAGNRTTQKHPDYHKKRKLQWYGHVSRSSSLAKTILRSTVKGGRRRQIEEEVGRQHQGMDRPGALQVTESSGEQWLWNHLWCPNDPRG